MFAPAITNLGNVIADMTSTPEVASFGRMNISDSIKRRYLPYTPVDREYLANRYRAQAGAATRGIIDSSGGNSAAARASLIAQNFNSQNALGDMYKQLDDTNRNRLIQSLTFDTQQDAQRAQLLAQEQGFNAQMGMQEYDINARNRAAKRNAVRAGINTVGRDIGEVGKYMNNTDIVNLLYSYDKKGNYKK